MKLPYLAKNVNPPKPSKKGFETRRQAASSTASYRWSAAERFFGELGPFRFYSMGLAAIPFFWPMGGMCGSVSRSDATPDAASDFDAGFFRVSDCRMPPDRGIMVRRNEKTGLMAGLLLVGEERIELSWSCDRWLLKPVRLPIPPLARRHPWRTDRAVSDADRQAHFHRRVVLRNQFPMS